MKTSTGAPKTRSNCGLGLALHVWVFDVVGLGS